MEEIERIKKYTNLTPDALEDLDYIENYITNLQAELQEANDSSTWWNNRYKAVERLCNKYEEEHKITFEEWKKDIKANKKAIRQIEIILEIALEQDSENVNLIDRLRYVLNLLQGVDKE